MMESHAVGGRAASDRGSDGLTDAFDVLTDEVRCAAIEYLATTEGTVSLDSVVDFVMATPAAPDGTREQTKIRFHHVHLPKMDAADLVDYDWDDRTIEPTEKLDLAMQLLSPEAEIRH